MRTRRKKGARTPTRTGAAPPLLLMLLPCSPPCLRPLNTRSCASPPPPPRPRVSRGQGLAGQGPGAKREYMGNGMEPSRRGKFVSTKLRTSDSLTRQGNGVWAIE